MVRHTRTENGWIPEGRHPFQNAPHTGSSRQRIRNNVFSGLQAGTSGTDVNRKYIRYSGKYIVPTPKGMFTYETIRGKKIADTSLTADWEKQLSGLESGMITGQDFLNRIRTLAKEMTDDIFITYSTKEVFC